MIPIISPETVEEIGEVGSRIKKIKMQKIEKKKEEKHEIPLTKSEEDVLTKTVEDIIGEEGNIEGKEEEILEKLMEEIGKEEKKRSAKEKQKEKKERETIHVGPLYPGLPTPEKEHIHEKPFVPIGNYCCNKLCKHLNDEIFNKEETLGGTVPFYIKGEPQPSYRSFISIPYSIEALKDYRYLLYKNNTCKCYKETEEIEDQLPVIGGSPKKLISSRTGKPVTSGGLTYELPKSMIHIAHRKDKPVVPTHDGCCKEACEILTKKISKMEDMIDKIELRGGKELKPKLGLSQRYEALAFKTFALQEYRTKLTKNNICECTR
jgi:hypothetical protein